MKTPKIINFLLRIYTPLMRAIIAQQYEAVRS